MPRLRNFSCALALSFATSAFAQFPERPITMIVPFPPGGVADTVARPMAEALSRDLGQPVVIENKPGAGGGIGMAQVAKAKPDGYTILLALSSYSVLPEADRVMGRTPAYQLADLKPIARVTADPTVLAVRADAPWQTYADFIAAARAAPGKLTFGSSGNYGTMHMPMAMLAQQAGVQLTHVPYTGAGPAIVGLLGGQVDALADSSSWAPQVKAGKMRLLATWGEKRTQDFPDVPTLREQGWDVVVDAPNGVGAPRGLEPAIAAKLREALRAAVASPEFTGACAKIDAPVMYLDGPDYERYVAATYRRETALIERLNLRELIAKG